MVLDNESPWDGILASTMLALHATVQTTTQYTPAPLVYRRDSILNTRHEANWQLIKKRKQDLINKEISEKIAIEKNTSATKGESPDEKCVEN